MRLFGTVPAFCLAALGTRAFLALGDLKPRFVPEFLGCLFLVSALLGFFGGEVGLALAITVSCAADHVWLPCVREISTARSRRSNGPFLPRWSFDGL